MIQKTTLHITIFLDAIFNLRAQHQKRKLQ
jgi:hypothetical protein